MNQRDFDVMLFAATLDVDHNDPHIKETKMVIDNIQMLKDDPWSARQSFFGLAGGCENQVQYLATNFVPNLERRLNILEGRGILGESDLSAVKWANEDAPHINDDVTIDEQIDDVKTQLDNINDRMRRETIEFILFVQAHDELSQDLGQISYKEIKARAAMNRLRRAG